jgi:hypothetical protein
VWSKDVEAGASRPRREVQRKIAGSQPLLASTWAARAHGVLLHRRELDRLRFADAFRHHVRYQPLRHPPEIPLHGRLPEFRHVELEGGGELTGVRGTRCVVPFLDGIDGRGNADRKKGLQCFWSLPPSHAHNLSGYFGMPFVTALVVAVNCLPATLSSMPSALLPQIRDGTTDLDVPVVYRQSSANACAP